MQKKHLIKSSTPFMIKTLSKVGIQGTYLNLIKALYDKPTGNIIVNGQKTISISIKFRNQTRISAFTSLFLILT